jgi:predicted dehydrogenase
LIGVHGYGAVHVRELDRLAERGRARFVACADVLAPSGTEAGVIGRLGAAYFADWRQMLDRAIGLDVVVIASPPHLHAEMSLAALESGSHLFLEKPPVVSAGDLEVLVKATARTGLLCQVGFQSLGSAALDRLREILDQGDLGSPTRLVATGQWQRDRAYWERSEWAGKEAIGGMLVRDGALSNPFAHAVMNCLVALGADNAGLVSTVDVERYRANPIEVEDTACARVTLRNGAKFSIAVTLCAERVEAPALHLRGPLGTATWSYEGDIVSMATPAGSKDDLYSRQSLLEQLLAVVQGQISADCLSCPLERAHPFVEVVEMVHSAPVYKIPDEHLRWDGDGNAARAVVVGVGGAISNVLETGELFSELAVPWAANTGAK